MTYKITGYQPERLFHFFEDISAIPRGSSNEKAVSDYLVAFAKERGLWYHQDALHNVIIKKPASAGAEDKPAVMLQGHLDMVCEKLAGVDHDFEKDGIDLIVKDGVLTANGTTLGGDNGAAVALMLAVLDDDALAHPALECVFTTQEETGLTGAAGLDKSLISARTMINLDSEEEGIATVSCAGGMRFTMTRPITRHTASGKLLTIDVSGLLGGHSGTDINKERQNGIILLARLINRVLHETGAQLASFAGGSKDNAIPREVSAVLVCSDADIEKAQSIADALAADFAAELVPFEPDFKCTISAQDGAAEVLSEADAKAFISAICLAPNGVRRRNLKQDGFVVTSLNLGVARMDDTTASLVFAPRSSVASLQNYTTDCLYLLAETFGFDCDIAGAYPGWSFAEESPIRDTFIASYRELFDADLKIEAIHAGLECGLFSDALPGLDAIAVGPTIRGCHTPDEYLPLDSFERFYSLLTDVLSRLAKH
ncbi:aminoacyl-histidine dipeptidase [Butyricicoccus pullicaecorum]|uniref:Cytosol non-specific dipeptidase n=1 Tax=Butyricicoccus pullicaecorum TaxID=501571 RepID=A0A1Y4LSS6_9FIRM|nr:aminoacyl-histidine dipeptidase [Butyricicoccus pullicaecorum]OUP59705.1 aminoacyl-histidine dipeptidase [Butyricicoccus pullicaecorum]